MEQEIARIKTKIIELEIKERKIITACLISIIGIWIIPIVILTFKTEINTLKETVKTLENQSK